MIPANWLDTHRDQYKAKYDFSLPLDQWLGEQVRDFCEFVMVAYQEAGSSYDAAYQAALSLGVPKENVVVCLNRAAIFVPVIASAPAPAEEAPTARPARHDHQERERHHRPGR